MRFILTPSASNLVEPCSCKSQYDCRLIFVKWCGIRFLPLEFGPYFLLQWQTEVMANRGQANKGHQCGKFLPIIYRGQGGPANFPGRRGPRHPASGRGDGMTRRQGHGTRVARAAVAHKSLSIRQIAFDIFVHPQPDAACAARGVPFFFPLSQRYQHALLIATTKAVGARPCYQTTCRRR